ncbi:MAG: molybdopterin-synthase adenylyltransferase MoeB [Bacteroidia bacterium]|nr:molybdopterin-synthase adenylyltransferase MoeB [Bacteroidia bacterium]MDW8158129.1 molybdopterin-synthase adenylyltransferase MoeB [Bacteroidia bacterium]
MNNIGFSAEELARYNRHIIIPEFGIEGQRRLKAAKVLVVGTGGLGSPALLYLAAAGVGHIGIVDFDVVEDSNLHRQVLFSKEDVGYSKVEAAKKKLLALNPHIHIEVFNTRLTANNALGIISNYDVVADGTDNFPTRYLVNDACYFLRKPNVYASIFQFEGQVSVFNYIDKNGEIGPNYRDIFASPPPPGLVPSCAEGGVLGVLPGIIGSIQALEVIKVVTGIGKVLSGRIFAFDALTFQTRIFNITKDPNNPLSGNNPTILGLIDYEQFCGVAPAPANAAPIKEITALELKQLIESGANFELIDVREPFEYEICNLGGKLIPLGEIKERLDCIPRDKLVVVHCKMGGRSAKAIELLLELGYHNLVNLKGGIIAYASEVDTSIPKY